MIGKLLVFILFVALSINAYFLFTSDPKAESQVEEILAADKAFAHLADEKGTLNAFYQYMADDGKVLPQQSDPVDKKYYRNLLEKIDRPDSLSVLHWQPLEARIAESGDLGYSFGTYQQFSNGPDAVDTLNGYYLTVWQKQSDGQWKFVWDTGNSVERKNEH